VFKYQLKSVSALAGYSQDFEGVKLREITDLAIVSIAIPLDSESLVTEAFNEAYSITLPEIGKSEIATDTRLVRLARDQLFALFSRSTLDVEKFVSGKLRSKAYTTDQTDGWVAIEISGLNAGVALERICPIDLHPAQFEVDDFARTSMEHLGTLIIKTNPETYLLLSASSSAYSFLHAVETSIKNIL